MMIPIKHDMVMSAVLQVRTSITTTFGRSLGGEGCSCAAVVDEGEEEEYESKKRPIRAAISTRSFRFVSFRFVSLGLMPGASS